jgi:hypothetical protein
MLLTILSATGSAMAAGCRPAVTRLAAQNAAIRALRKAGQGAALDDLIPHQLDLVAGQRHQGQNGNDGNHHHRLNQREAGAQEFSWMRSNRSR